ncbi:hypothetical protein PR202_gb28685 [Eleusine coracana subsp. coracana]|uniref:Uncharacterized protein n=1 Tax=Eleusine coracana subsp. coracana TaxID=191504 RepID=A0AAV5FXZ5_ELECO|nr:hypothetical protein PR202_gb28685 [Eleusine coracana subsp. coracana]
MADAGDLLGERGLLTVARTEQALVTEMEAAPLAGMEHWIERVMPLPFLRLDNVAASPRFNVYEAADFGFGWPQRVELISRSGKVRVPLRSTILKTVTTTRSQQWRSSSKSSLATTGALPSLLIDPSSSGQRAVMGNPEKLMNQIFELKFTSKSLQRQARKCEKEEKEQKLKVKKAMEKGNMDGARIYAENVSRKQWRSQGRPAEAVASPNTEPKKH